LREAEALRPEVIVTDIAMPGLDGIVATSALLAGTARLRGWSWSRFKTTHAWPAGYAGTPAPAQHREAALSRLADLP
jgi:CheY-like chemotaxis protein